MRRTSMPTRLPSVPVCFAHRIHFTLVRKLKESGDFMRKGGRRIFLYLLTVFLLLSMVPTTTWAAGESGLYVNGDPFPGTLEEAILAGRGGTVTVSGTVYTKPVGRPDSGILIENVTIEGVNNAKIVLQRGYWADISNKVDVLTLRGQNVTLRNLEVDAGFRVDFPIRIFPGSAHILLENVVARHGTRGAVNLLSSADILLRGVQANESIQGGFYFDDVYDASGIRFENCSTSGNLRTGVLIRNGYGPCINVNLEGITCHEGTFAVEDRMAGTIGGSTRAEITITHAPKNASGTAISTDKAIYYPVETAYQHIRYGISNADLIGASATILIDRYGMETCVYYLSLSAAEKDLREGETITKCNGAQAFFGKIAGAILLLPRLLVSLVKR